MNNSPTLSKRTIRFFAVAVVLSACACWGGCKLPSMGQAVSAGAAYTLASEHGTLFYAFDTLTQPEKSTELLVRVIYVKKFEKVEKAEVEFTLGRESLGKVLTDKDGYARMKWKAPKAGDYEIKARIVAVPDDDFKEMLKVTPASLLVSARTKDTRFVVIDLDHTVVASGFSKVLMGGAKPMPQAAKIVKELAGGGYSIIYLTHRPDLLANKSKKWLTDKGFIRSPLLVSSLKQSIGDSGKFKTARLKELKKEFPNIRLGIGDKISDVEAYVANGMTAYLIPNYDREDDDADDFRKLAKKIRRLDKRIHVVDGWDEIRAGVLDGKAFSAVDYADRLDARARALKERKKKKDDDDDDD